MTHATYCAVDVVDSAFKLSVLFSEATPPVTLPRYGRQLAGLCAPADWVCRPGAAVCRASLHQGALHRACTLSPREIQCIDAGSATDLPAGRSEKQSIRERRRVSLAGPVTPMGVSQSTGWTLAGLLERGGFYGRCAGVWCRRWLFAEVFMHVVLFR